MAIFKINKTIYIISRRCIHRQCGQHEPSFSVRRWEKKNNHYLNEPVNMINLLCKRQFWRRYIRTFDSIINIYTFFFITIYVVCYFVGFSILSALIYNIVYRRKNRYYRHTLYLRIGKCLKRKKTIKYNYIQFSIYKKKSHTL